MDLLQMTKDLADILTDKNLAGITVKQNDVEIRVEAKQEQVGGGNNPVTTIAPVTTVNAPVSAAARSGSFIKAPIVGTFYVASAPDKPPFVKVGDRIVKGQVVCIIESMKLMNEITSEFDGTVAEILVNDGDAVDFNKELMRIE